MRAQNEHKRISASKRSQICHEEYDRLRDLPSLIALWPSEICDFSPAGTHKIICRLLIALRAERERGRSGHWSYNLERHLGLARAYKAESA